MQEVTIKKQYVDPNSLRTYSFMLAKMVTDSNFRPDFMIALWRGGAAIGMYIHEFFKWVGLKTDHIAIRTTRYSGIDQAHETVEVHNLSYVLEKVNRDTKLLIVDDIFDTGRSIEAVIDTLKTKLGNNMPTNFRVATVFYKPERNQTQRTPDYCIGACTVSANTWVVFPHEVEGMDLHEIFDVYGYYIGEMFKEASAMLNSKDKK